MPLIGAAREFYNSSPMREGVLCWYPFKPGASVRDLTNGALTDFFTRKNLKISFNEPSDYIVVIDPDDFGIDALGRLKSQLSPDGRLLLAYENPFALRYWAGTKAPNTGVPYDTLYQKGDNPLPGKAELGTRLERAGFFGQKWYYLASDHWFTREIYTDNFMPNEYMNQRFMPYITDDAHLQFNEIPLYREVIRGGAYSYMCAAYLVEAWASADSAPCSAEYVAVTAYRSSAKRFATVIEKDRVYKTPLHADGITSPGKIHENLSALKALGVKVIDTELVNDTLVMPRLNMPTLQDYWAEKLSSQTFDENELISHFDMLVKNIKSATSTGKCYWEMVPANCFYCPVNNELIFFDQEFYWDNVSSEVAIVRALWALDYSPAFRMEPRSKNWLEALKIRYGVNEKEKWEELSAIADKKARDEIFNSEDRVIVQETDNALIRISAENRHERSIRKQGKVSMVVPCYNKVNFIGAMLDSVIAQKWDNIELILVNDGSTDGTREIISAYSQKIISRGYELIIIDQENAGCCAAVYAGLIKMTGDYFCLVDCDDEIEPQYVSHMANWLDTNEDCEWTACSYSTVRHVNGEVTYNKPPVYKYPQNTDRLLEKYILRQTITTVWIYMSRISYVKKCGLIENFCLERRKTYEPLIMVPLAHGGGKIEFFNEPLYKYNQTALDLFRFDYFQKCIDYYDDYLYLYKWSIDRLSSTNTLKIRLWSIAKLAYYRELFVQLNVILDGKFYINKVAYDFANTINTLFEPSPEVSPIVAAANFQRLYDVVVSTILGDYSEILINPSRVIGYGALGRAAVKILPMLDHTGWKPTELWDKNGDGEKIKTPDVSSLCEGDLVLVIPSDYAVVNEIKSVLSNIPARIIYRNELNKYMDSIFFYSLIKARLAIK